MPEPLLSGPFTVGQARELGVSRQRTRARDLIAPSAGIRLPTAVADDLRQRAHSYVVAVPGAVVSHGTAAALWEIALPSRIIHSKTVHLVQPPGTRACRRQGAHGHVCALRSSEVVQGNLFGATSPERTWFDLAQCLTLDELIIAGDFLVRRNEPLSSIEKLEEQVRIMGRHRGVRAAREALTWIRPRTDSPKETELRLLLVRPGLPEPCINVAITDESDEWVQDPDMSYPDLRIALQYEGGHHISEFQRRSDIARDDRAFELGWLVLRYSQMDLQTVPNRQTTAVRKTLLALERRGWRRQPAA